MKKVLISLVMFCASLACAQPTVSASTMLVIDADAGVVLVDKDGEQQRPIASITKMMTALVILDSQIPLDEVLTMTDDDVKGTLLRGKPTSTSLAVGTKLTRREFLQLALMNSQNRAAYVLARTFPGGVETFVRIMNEKARELGMTSTSFADPTGLTNLNVSTAKDLAILVQTASINPEIQQFSTARSLSLQMRKKKPQTFGTTNRLVAMTDWDIVAQKTGYIAAAGRCMVMMTKIATKRVIIILLNAPSNNARAGDAISIKKWMESRPAQ